MPAVCPTATCDYTYEDATISITDFSYSHPTATMTKVGTFDASSDFTTFQVNSADCQTLTETATTITCTLDPNKPVSGPIKLTAISSSGTIQVSYLDSAATLPINFASLVDNSVNAAGGTILELVGTNFPSSLDSGDSISIDISNGEGTCKILTTSSTSITCMTSILATAKASGFASLSSLSLTLDLTINGLTSSLPITIDSSSLQVVSVTPNGAISTDKTSIEIVIDPSYPEA